jgi:hypothetical protein
LLHYLRYDGEITMEWLERNAGITLSKREIAPAQEIDDPSAIDVLIRIGRGIAANQMKPEHFPDVFNTSLWRPT